MVKQQWLTLSYDSEENLPTFVDLGHNLKQKNTFKSDVEMILNMPNYYIMHKKIKHEDKEVYIVSTHLKKTFIRGFLYYNDKEYEIVDYKTYSSLKVEDIFHDNISVIRLLENPF
jgi:hypothetical protein